jgi:hypothetical protein
MPSKSKNKGNRGEAELAKILGNIFTGNFARVPNSGAMVGGLNAYRKHTLSQIQNRIYRGDLIPPDHMPKFVVESKNYDEFRFHQLMSPGKCLLLDEWISQTIDCIDPGDAWFVCFKITRISWFCAVPIFDQNYVFNNYSVYNSVHGKFHITELNDFFETNKDKIMELSF